jgi:hypothetical protein
LQRFKVNLKTTRQNQRYSNRPFGKGASAVFRTIVVVLALMMIDVFVFKGAYTQAASEMMAAAISHFR